NRILPECIEKDEKDEKKKKKPQKCIDVNGKKYSLGENSGIKKSPRYIIEYLGTNSADKRTIYRVTAKAWGKNANTQVVLQSYVASE
ncbi:MAG: pilus assembly protein, partial [Neisseria sp.]|nr:pilus assembly protein [Neisseria sp.]